MLTSTSTVIASSAFSALLVAAFGLAWVRAGDLPEERALWSAETAKTKIRYDGEEKVRTIDPPPASLSGKNRVFSRISSPSYTIHRPEEGKWNGVGLVICPGGGYNDVWLDREGHDLALKLKEFGITSLVLKYRTNTSEGGKRPFPWEDYLPEVVADAHQAIRTLRDHAEDLKLRSDRIGICGYSAGGHLALSAVLEHDASDPASEVNFAGLLYPWINGPPLKETDGKGLPPMFLMNAADDRVTPAKGCTEFFLKLLEAGVKAELHVYTKGGHGFDLGTGRLASAALWSDNFAAWLVDLGLVAKSE